MQCSVEAVMFSYYASCVHSVKGYDNNQSYFYEMLIASWVNLGCFEEGRWS